MDTKYSISYHGSNWQIFEGICNCLPKFNVEFSLALVIEAIDLVQVTGFMITSEEKEVERKFDFVCHEETVALEGSFASVYVVSQEKIIAISRLSHFAKNREEIVVLSMDISADDYWGL
jgi:hypothetical protein